MLHLTSGYLKMKEININIEGYNVNGICVGCLNFNRRMFYDNDAKEVFKLIGNIDVPDGLNIQVCWECLAAVKSVVRFQKQILNSFEVLISYSDKHTFLNSPEDFTCHSSTRLALTDKTEHLDIIPKFEWNGESKEKEDEHIVKEEEEKEFFLELDPNTIKEEPYEDNFKSDVYMDPVADSTDEDIQLSQLKDQTDRQTSRQKKRKKEKKKKKKLKEPIPEDPPKGRKLKNLPSDIIQLYTMTESEMHTVRASDIQSESFTKLKYKCDDCIIGFNTEKLKEYHMNGKHKPKSKSCQQCDVCKAYFLTKENLSSHRALHLAAFRCAVCGHVTTLKRVMAAHECAKPFLADQFQCADCDMVFSDSGRMGSEYTDSDRSKSDKERNAGSKTAHVENRGKNNRKNSDESSESENENAESRTAQETNREKYNRQSSDESRTVQESSREKNSRKHSNESSQSESENENDENRTAQVENRGKNNRQNIDENSESENESVSCEAITRVINETLTIDSNENHTLRSDNIDPLNNDNNRNKKFNRKSKSKIINIDSESENEESFSIQSRGVTRKISKLGGTKSNIQNPEPLTKQMSSLQLSNPKTAQAHNNCENCPKIDKLISLAETLNANQKTLFNTINDLENRVLKKLEHLSVKFDEFVQKNVEKIVPKATKPDAMFKIITNKAQLDKFEDDLENLNYKNDLKKRFSKICPKGKGRAGHNAYVLIDALFSRKFLTECSWSGGSRSDHTKIPFKKYKNLMEFFFEIVYESDNTYTMYDCEHFLRIILKNSQKRTQGSCMRKSTPRHRRRADMLLERQLDPTAQANTQQLLGLMQAISHFESENQPNVQEEITDQ